MYNLRQNIPDALPKQESVEQNPLFSLMYACLYTFAENFHSSALRSLALTNKQGMDCTAPSCVASLHDLEAPRPVSR